MKVWDWRIGLGYLAASLMVSNVAFAAAGSQGPWSDFETYCCGRAGGEVIVDKNAALS